MKAILHDVVCCPVCGGDLSVTGGAIACTQGHQYACDNGIPRLVPTTRHTGIVRTGRAFGFQWTHFEVGDRAEDERVFLAKTGFSREQLSGRLVLDAGCGGGRYLRIASALGANVVGIDLSDAVEHAQQFARDTENVAVLQGDLLNPPFKSATFDAAYSIGVLHHTPSTEQAFRAIARLVKPGGQLAVWLYRKNTWWQELVNDAVRAVTTRLPIPVLVALARMGAVIGGMPVLRHANKLVNFSSHRRWETRVCDTFDWYAPPYQDHHTVDELVAWFRDAGYDDLRVLYSQPSNGPAYRWAYDHNLIIGSGVNVVGRRSERC